MAIKTDTKLCTKCGEAKPLSEFYMIQSGHRAGKYHAKCRACHSVQSTEYRQQNAERVKEVDRLYYVKNKAARAEKSREWAMENRDKRNQSTNKHRAMNPKQKVANGAVNDAVRRGKFPPAWTMVCDGCREAQAAHWHHHKGYDAGFKLDVIAVCAQCHGEIHAAPEPDLSILRNKTRAKLTAEQVRKIRERASHGEKFADIAKSMEIGRNTVGDIVRGRTWTNL